jgi:alpha/beta superfamily hydrolase
MDPLETGKFIATLAALAGFYFKINSSLRTMAGKGDAREITNNPLNTQSISRPATMEDVQAVARRVTKLEEQIVVNARNAENANHEMLGRLDELRDRLDDKLTTVAERLHEISRAVGRLEGS